MKVGDEVKVGSKVGHIVSATKLSTATEIVIVVDDDAPEVETKKAHTHKEAEKR